MPKKVGKRRFNGTHLGEIKKGGPEKDVERGGPSG